MAAAFRRQFSDCDRYESQWLNVAFGGLVPKPPPGRGVPGFTDPTPCGTSPAMLPRLFTVLSALFFASAVWSEPAPMPPGYSLQAVVQSVRPQERTMTIPEARWGTSGERGTWSLAALSALRGPARNLPAIVPEDIATWCPAYESAGREDREAFWVGLVSALAKHESTYRPTAVGGGGRWYGLLQILPSTARHYNCQAGCAADRCQSKCAAAGQGSTVRRGLRRQWPEGCPQLFLHTSNQPSAVSFQLLGRS